MKRHTLFVLFFLLVAGTLQLKAQSTNPIVAQVAPDRTLIFDVTDAGVDRPIIWGLDLAWLSESNIRRGISYMGADRVDVVRASFQPNFPLVNGDLQAAQVTDLNTRLNLIDLTGTKTKIVLNCDHPSVYSSYLGNAANWAQLMDVTTRRIQERGRTVISISPFNEPDYGWGQYSGQNGQLDFYNIAGELRKNPRFDSIRISGGNTLNCDQALPWYNYLKTRLEEGNTHQLAGSFDNFANFYTNVRANGDHATGDELHNVMEAMVGVEYGMQTGIWWGTAELARGEFVKASDGKRLAYAEHRPNWTAASVYRSLEGKVQAFGGTSERQAATTTYRFVSKDRDVFYDGYGPQREYSMVLPGGTAYQTGQTNAECVVNVTWGDDIQPIINGRYVLVNRNSGKVLEVAGASTTAGAGLRQNVYTNATHQQWNVTPVDSRVGGDYSYFTMTAVHSGKAPDVLNWSLNNGGSIVAWDDTKGANQQWILDYVEDGWFYLRNRHSVKCLEVANASTAAGASIQQWEKDGGTNQQWRLVPVDAPLEFIAPVEPTNLLASANSESIRLDWAASSDADVSGYTIFRSDSLNGAYQTIARDVATTSFVDHTTATGKTYFYKLRAVDKSLNRSGYSNIVSSGSTGNDALLARYQFDGSTLDSTVNMNHAASSGGVTFVEGKVGSQAVMLNGTNAFLQLPFTIANQQDITIATWVYWNGSTTGQRIFDFGNITTDYMYLTPKVALAGMRFSIKKGTIEQQLNAPALPVGKWSHVAVTLGASGAKMYVNGSLVSESNTITLRPIDFKPLLNYIGRSQSTYPYFNGAIDDFRVYNYELSANEIAQIPGVLSGTTETSAEKGLSVWPVPAKNILHVQYDGGMGKNGSVLRVYSLSGQELLSKNIAQTVDLDVSDLPSDNYLLKLSNNKETLVRKITVKHAE